MLLTTMHTKTNTPAKEMVELDMPAAQERQTSFLEDDLAISSSTHDSFAEKTITEPEEKTTLDETTRQSDQTNSEPDQPPVIYVSEDAMDCNYDESSNLSRPQQPQPQHFELQDAPSPELFESDADDEAESTNTTSTFQKSLEEARTSLPSPKKLTTPELILKADKFLLRRVNKFLSGVPPPPNHTISQKDCDDFLVYIKQNRQYFWADPFKLDEKDAPVAKSEASVSQQESNQEKSDETTTTTTTSMSSKVFSQISQKAPLRNLSTAFDACERSSYLQVDKNDSVAVDAVFSDTTSSLTLSDTLLNSSIVSSSTFAVLNEDSKLGDSDDKEAPPTLFTSISCEEVAKLSWPAMLKHKCPEIYYNRNKAMEEFENLRLKLCDRYIGAETQSTCNVWFAKQMPGSARKRSLLARRNMGQSPGKRLSHLAKRRRTFSSANVQGLGLAEKKQIILNAKKVIRRKKSPRGKTPRKTPRSSAKKRQIRRLMLEGPSPRKSKIETSKRALFQSPPNDRPGPSRLSLPTSTVTTSTINNNPQKIKRALFPTPKKNEVDEISQSQPMNFVDSRKSSQPQTTISFTESKKRKSEEELEHSKHKWAKSLSFDCTRNLENSSSNTWNRHSTGSSLSKDYGKCELSETHRKKLLWAVAEALRGKGIGYKDPMFKQYAASLARKVRMYMPELENKNVPRKPGSTSDRMLKLAKRHVLLIVEAKTAL
ncbi:uncharacterized protein LOC100679267 [Nasonia vitripennis]|uniref:Uncharacterized protein n=1 Tax=Nasonia vitripennis TaxID=7425 RepID=A0A7M7HJ96_NASVI|nr:uncharacterized protein LOC100679267 [Nasonia vitripennis]XP_016842070.1 uncharacterized protein LOC100679267 [Nasonia vitripennis]